MAENPCFLPTNYILTHHFKKKNSKIERDRPCPSSIPPQPGRTLPAPPRPDHASTAQAKPRTHCHRPGRNTNQSKTNARNGPAASTAQAGTRRQLPSRNTPPNAAPPTDRRPPGRRNGWPEGHPQTSGVAAQGQGWPSGQP
jgi:hypothetical protein